ncbi:hypothetical protein BDN70DRAFT_817902, partial [Pholiota conissans]
MRRLVLIEKTSTKLDESIRSMFKWYRRSDICIAYLGETQNIQEIHRDRWFTRGWTIQELIAPFAIKFCNRDWDIINQITKATSITVNEFTNFLRLPLSRRMQLAASRQVTREEDTAYSLMGIFDVSIATAYGEGGERAFFRLLEAIL